MDIYLDRNELNLSRFTCLNPHMRAADIPVSNYLPIPADTPSCADLIGVA